MGDKPIVGRFKNDDDVTGASLETVDLSRLKPAYAFAFVMMKYFGFPILVASAFGWWIYHQDQQSRADRESDRAAFIGAIDKNTDKLSELVHEIRRLEDGHR